MHLWRFIKNDQQFHLLLTVFWLLSFAIQLDYGSSGIVITKNVVRHYSFECNGGNAMKNGAERNVYLM